MTPSYLLVSGPPVRASSWQPTAELLRNSGFSVQVPDVLAGNPSPPSWSAWTSHLLELITLDESSIVVGHSSACALAVELATKKAVRGVILVDGDIPPPQGAASPVRPALLGFIASIADETGALPPWSRWFANDAARASLVGIDILQRDAVAFARFDQELPRLRVEWFNDVIELDRWDHVRAGYIQASQIYDHVSAEAIRRGWPVAKLNGTHLDPTIRPVVMAEAIISMTRSMGLARN